MSNVRPFARHQALQVVKAAIAYFALVFGAGFFMGVVRVPFLVPRLGIRTAELLEMPLMFVAIVLSARFVVRRFALAPSVAVRLGTGLTALFLVVLAELSFAATLGGQTPAEYVAGRDPISGSVYLAMLCVFAAMPLILARLRGATAAHRHQRA
jgi:hypothetical protein